MSVSQLDVAPKHAGIVFAAGNTSATAAGLLAVPVTGLLLDLTGSWVSGSHEVLPQNARELAQGKRHDLLRWMLAAGAPETFCAAWALPLQKRTFSVPSLTGTRFCPDRRTLRAGGSGLLRLGGRQPTARGWLTG